MHNINDSFNNNKDCEIYVNTKKLYQPTIEDLKNHIDLAVRSAGKRYAPKYSEEYKKLNIKIDNLEEAFNVFNFNEFKKFVLKYTYFIYGKGDSLLSLEENNIDIKIFSEKDKKSFNKIMLEIKKFKDIDNLTYFQKYYFSNFINMLNTNLYNLDHILIKFLGNNYFEDYIHNMIRGEAIRSLIKFSKNIKNKIFIKSCILLTGEALIGKTHFFCDIAIDRINQNLPTILLFGQNFKTNEKPIRQIIKQLDLDSFNLSEDEFLKVLDDLGEKYNSKTLIMVDAINETDIKSVWRDNLIEFIEKIKKYENLALAMSIRDVEKSQITTKNSEKYIAENVVEVIHNGFSGIENQALKKFCEIFKIEMPTIPILSELFINAGVLFIFMEIIQKKGLSKLDNNIINPTYIFENFLTDLNERFSNKFNIDTRRKIVQKAIEKIVELIIKNDFDNSFEYDEVYEELYKIDENILDFLESEGVLSKLYEEDKLYFTYQKFKNYFIVEYLLNNFDNSNINELKNNRIIKKIVNNISEYKAILESLFIQIPEKFKLEVFDIFPNLQKNYEVQELFIKSLTWRSNNSITDKIDKYINSFIKNRKNKSLFEVFLETILTLAPIPNHYFNIEKIHQLLLKMEMNKRDYRWSIFLHNSYQKENSTVKRVINWAWEKDESFEINNESLYLYGLTLSWFLTSSNRELRDSSTKALVNLFTNRVDIFLKVLREFENVNDLYILERLYAVAYGIVLRSSDKNGFKELGNYIYNTIFNKDKVIEHIMIMDYAKNSIEVILNEFVLNVDKKKIKPPYGSKIDDNIADENIIHNEDYKMIYDSLIYDDIPKPTDFGHYILSNTLDEFDTRIENEFAQRWIFKKVIKNWKFELFKDFDEKMSLNKWDRNANKPERIGKKYQWIAFYEFLAKIADNYALKTRFENENSKYKGTYQLNIRDIDPTTISKKENLKDENYFWRRENYNFNLNIDNREWILKKDDLPKIENLIFLDSWLTLDRYFILLNKQDKNMKKFRQLHYVIQSYLIKKNDLKNIIEYYDKNLSFGNTIITANESIENIFLREYKFKCKDNFKTIYKNFKTLKTSKKYFREAGNYDCSIDENIEIWLPSSYLMNQMNITHSTSDSEFINQNSKVVFFSPSIGNSYKIPYRIDKVLLVDKKIFLNFLEQNNLTIFWLLLGEKVCNDRNLGRSNLSGYGYFENGKFKEEIKIVNNYLN